MSYLDVGPIEFNDFVGEINRGMLQFSTPSSELFGPEGLVSFYLGGVNKFFFIKHTKQIYNFIS